MTGAEGRSPDLLRVAAVVAVAIGVGALAAVLYALVDVLIAFFLGIVVAAAVQPWHARLGQLGIPRGVAVLAIYLLFFAGLLFILLLVGPVLVEEITSFAAEAPAQYAELRRTLGASSSPLLQTVSRRLPEQAELQQLFASVSPAVFRGVFGFTTGLLGFSAYFVTVFAVGFYWTLELPRIERLVLSLTPVERRGQVLDAWHEIEAKLGAFIRGQATAMLAVGLASGLGYMLIGLPNVLALAVLAGLLEAVPLIGPTLAAIPAVAVAATLGLTPVLLVLGWTVLVQVLENNVLIPRIMGRTVGMSPLLGIFAVLGFSILYGVVGTLVAIPVTAVIQVLFERSLLAADLPPDPRAAAALGRDTRPPLERIRERAEALRQQARARMRARESRIATGSDVEEGVGDVVDQEVERAVDLIQTTIDEAGEDAANLPREAQGAIATELERAIEHVAAAVPPEDADDGAASRSQADGASGARPTPPRESALRELERAERAVRRAEEQVDRATPRNGKT